MPDTTGYRVVQWTTGNVGKSSVAAIAKNPTLELVGCYAWSGDKVGKDVGELCGIEPLGVSATDDVDALLALKPDVVVYNPMWIDVDELVRILESGVNVVSTASFITGHNQGTGRDRIAEACTRGGSSMFGSGISPGYVNQLSVVAAGICDRVDKITVNEAADTTFYDSPATEKPVGFGQPIDHPDLQAMTAQGTGVFGEAVRMIADASASNSTKYAAMPNTPRPQRISTWARGPSRRAAWRACMRAGRASSPAIPVSRSTSAGAKARRCNRIGRSIRTVGSSRWQAGRRSP